MKNLLFIVPLSFIMSQTFGQSLTISNISGCHISASMAGSSTCSPACACDHASNSFLVGATTLSWTDPGDFETGCAGGTPGVGWATGTAFTCYGTPATWRWSEIRFTVDCGGGNVCSGAMIWPGPLGCGATPAATWSGCGVNGSYTLGGGLVISFW